METTLNAINDLLTSNAVLEEQYETIRRSLKDLTLRVHGVEIAIAENHGSHKWIDKILWSVIGAGLSILFVSTKL